MKKKGLKLGKKLILSKEVVGSLTHITGGAGAVTGIHTNGLCGCDQSLAQPTQCLTTPCINCQPTHATCATTPVVCEEPTARTCVSCNATCICP
ncbi:class I lanthipeptide [Taibaiella koreensis]|uniref:class I lanthipeptide n=1 Tax=Taibaiella koreensis TaxID=1268548 RepID=UPI001968A69F